VLEDAESKPYSPEEKPEITPDIKKKDI